MSEIEFLGARLEKEIVEMVEKTAVEERIDKTKALKELIIIGRKKYLLQKYLQLYQQGKCSLDKAAKMVGLTMHEMMEEAVKAGIQSEQTIEEYKKGVLLLG